MTLYFTQKKWYYYAIGTTVIHKGQPVYIYRRFMLQPDLDGTQYFEIQYHPC